MQQNAPLDDPAKLALLRSLARALRLRCPLCGRRRLFRNWLVMYERCGVCGLRFERGPGYYLGSIYINYGLTALFVTAGYLALFFTDTFAPPIRLGLLAGFCLVFPLWFFRYARSLWLSLDLYFDPAQLKNDI